MTELCGRSEKVDFHKEVPLKAPKAEEVTQGEERERDSKVVSAEQWAREVLNQEDTES